MTLSWRSEVKGLMRDFGIKNKDLAEKLNVGDTYVASIFTARRNPPDREERFRRAVAEIIEERKANDVL